jgi:hypothetical protein
MPASQTPSTPRLQTRRATDPTAILPPTSAGIHPLNSTASSLGVTPAHTHEYLFDANSSVADEDTYTPTLSVG